MLFVLIKKFLGYVVFFTPCGNLERFITLCGKNGIRIWDIKRREEGFECSVGTHAYPLIRKFRKKCGMRMKIIQKHGLPFITHRALKRKGLAFGAVLFILIYVFLSSHIWSVEVIGNTKTTKEEILECAEREGLFEGMRKASLVPSLMKERLLLSLDNMSWLSVNTLGCTVTISVKEKTEKPEIYEKTEPCNVCSAYSGIVKSIEVFGGESLVKPGDAVEKGEILISGVIKNTDESTRLTYADGNVTVRAREAIYTDIEEKEIITEETGNCVYRCSAVILGAEIPLSLNSVPKGEYRRYLTKEPFMLGGFKLPVNILKEKWTELSQTEISYSHKEAVENAKAKALETFKKEFPEALLEKSEYSETVKGGKQVLCAAFVFSANASVKIPILDK